MKFLYEIFSCFKYCRKKLGGTWYQVFEDYDSYSGVGIAVVYWTQEKPTTFWNFDSERCILKTESYTMNKKN
jgi:hypothetical protein